ncbi:hypothetical protein JYU34_018885 [Plutella xylostella]|uniref:Uncharacterized protein n=1 Tax=Plutella xylostella TaxID=51655 RepID=A0ABQ7PYR4_PLUXY|nr:hypothetical protein JYU34_018885 [Plutella xylostella]
MRRCALRAALLACLLLPHASAESLRRCPAEDSPCPARSGPCGSDQECGQDQICCNTACGPTCVDPLNTGCENIRLSLERISRALAVENSRGGRGLLRGVRAPRCRATDGEFEEIQCDNEIVSSCWCVDPAGFEIAGTRAPAASLVNCTRTAPCAAHTCRMLCPLGFELDAKGCPLCKCRDPCSSITCPGQLSCQLEETPCIRPPCPPVATCKRGRSLQNICPVGEPLLISETNRPFLCGTDPGKPNCPPLYRCLVDQGNDYGVCCPASLELQKPSTCPAPSLDGECGIPCTHDLECPSVQKCCDGAECGRHCVLPQNVTKCTQQKMLAELLVISEKEGKGYVPQCAADGSFEWRQCSRNGLVCWCVDSDGNKLRGSMGPAASVQCSPSVVQARSGGRSLASECVKALCAGVCEYGYKTGSDGCPTCECDDPCAGYPCPDGEECIRVKASDCVGELCTGYPVCRPLVSYDNPCEVGTPASDSEGNLVSCKVDDDCPTEHTCNTTRRNSAAVCCPDPSGYENSSESFVSDMIPSCSEEAEVYCSLNSTVTCSEGSCDKDQVCCNTETCGAICVAPSKMQLQTDDIDATPTMCEYLRDFDEKMEGTVDGMRLALPPPSCTEDGSFTARQCAAGRCWCVDSFGTEIPETRTSNFTALDCAKIREELSCLDLTCRMGCDYGFELGANKCPTCKCREPCADVTCPDGRTCAVVDVACDADYCPPVPACLPRKLGQCPFLVPPNGACEWACRFDAECGPSERCCATGCGTACTKAVHQTACQQRRALAIHDAAESGNPPADSWIPACKEDGSYEDVQCKNSERECWCVDPTGNEIPGTRSANSTLSCSAPSKCPEITCNDIELQCPHSRKLDDKGCPTCECRDPCAEAKCRDDEKCELMKLDCEGESCPPIARCVPAPLCPDGGSPIQTPDGSSNLICGPTAAACPSSHACRFAPHDSRPPVCCPKPRMVCFETMEEGVCKDHEGLNTTRWHFNPEHNRCERFQYHGCAGNHNNFRTKKECMAVCPDTENSRRPVSIRQRVTKPTTPVLSACERLREKNEAAAQKYGKAYFIPKCDAGGAWENVQCMSHIDVCWCVSTRGEPLKGSLVRGDKPNCNFRQARKWKQRDPLDEKAQADEVLEELIRQMTAYTFEEYEEEDDTEDRLIDNNDVPEEPQKDEPQIISQKAELRSILDEKESLTTDSSKSEEKKETAEIISSTTEQVKPDEKPKEDTKKPIEKPTKTVFKTKCQLLQQQVENGSDGVRPRCLSDGSFSPRQCSRGRCWCVDAAGQRRPSLGVVPDLPEPDPCELTQIESASLELEIFKVDESIAERSRKLLTTKLARLGARVPVTLAKDREVITVRTMVAGPRAVDIIYQVENWLKEEKLSGVKKGTEGVLSADVIRSEYRLTAPAPAMQQREIVTESTLSSTTAYHTAIIVLAATSAFIISVLCVIVMLYRARLQREPHKAERFLPPAPPVYVLSADEKAELARVLHPPPPVHPQPSNDSIRN